MMTQSFFYPLDSLFYFVAADPFWALLIMFSVAFVFATIKEVSIATAALEAEVAALAAQVTDAQEAERKLRSEVAQAVAFRRRLRAMTKESLTEGQSYAETAEDTINSYHAAVEAMQKERDELLSELADLESAEAALTARQEELAAAHKALAIQVHDDAQNATAVLHECFANHEEEAMKLLARRDALAAENDELRAALSQMEADTKQLVLESQAMEQTMEAVEDEEPAAVDPLSVIEDVVGEASAPIIRTAASVGPTEESCASVAPERQVLGNATNRHNASISSGKKPSKNFNKNQQQTKKNGSTSSSNSHKNGKRRHRKALVKLVGSQENY